MYEDGPLSEKSSKAMAYVNSQANAVTTKSKAEKWEKNIRANSEYYQAGNAPIRGLAVFLVLAGPSLEKNVAELKRIGHLGVIIAVDAAFRHLMENGIVPDYCASIDSDGRCQVFTDGLDTSKTTLICMTSAAPEVISTWKGPRFFVNGSGGTTDAASKLFAMTRRVVLTKDLKAGHTLDIVEDMEVKFPGVFTSISCGGNVSTAAWSFAYEILRASKIIFVGSDFSWGQGNFYAGGHYTHLSDERKKERILSHPDLNDKTVFTNMSLSSFKNWHDTRAMMIPGTHVNASEGGILGIGDSGDKKTGKRLQGWEFMTLREAVDTYTRKEESKACPA